MRPAAGPCRGGRHAGRRPAIGRAAIEHIARVLLRRYGVVFRKLLERETGCRRGASCTTSTDAWKRAARCAAAASSAALPASSSRCRKPPPCCAGPRATEGIDRVSLSAADPLNLVGILTPGDRVRLAGNRLLFENGVPMAVHSGGDVRYLKPLDSGAQWELRNLLIRRQRPAAYLPESPASH